MDTKFVVTSNRRNPIDSSIEELCAKLKRIRQLTESLRTEEDFIKDLLRSNCAELHNDIENTEIKQRKLQEYLKRLPRID